MVSRAPLNLRSTGLPAKLASLIGLGRHAAGAGLVQRPIFSTAEMHLAIYCKLWYECRMPNRKQVTIQYRRHEDVTGAFSGLTLEAVVRQAMSRDYGGGSLREHWQRRAWQMPPGNEDTLFVNINHDGGSHYFGDLTLYSTGFMQALLTSMKDAPILNIEQEPAPDGKEYVHSMMYWMAIGNHVLLVQSQSLTAKSLENYLTWLLKEQTPTISDTGQVILQAKFDAAEVGGDIEDIREIIVGGASADRLAPVAPVEAEGEGRVIEEEAYRRLAEKRPWHEKAIEVLKIVMNNEADVYELLQSIPKEARLEVAVHIGFKTRKRSVSRAPMQRALRNLPVGEITAVGRDGRLTGNDLRLMHPASILLNGSLLDPEDVSRALRGAYTHFVENGKIEP